MADEIKKSFVKSFCEFLRKQIQEQILLNDALESLDVAIQCLEAAFELFPDDDEQMTEAGEPVVTASPLEGATGDSNAVPSRIQPIDLFDLYQTMYVEANPNRKELGETIKNEGNRLMKEGKFQEALLQYNRSITYDPKNPVFYCNRAAAYNRVGEHEKAVADCKMALVYNPDYSKAHGRMGIAYSNLNKFNEARAAYQRALELEPDNQDYRNNLRVAEERCSTGGTSGVNTARLAEVVAALSAATNNSGTEGGGGVNLADMLFDNSGLVNMRDVLSDIVRDPLLSTALQSLTQNPEGILEMSRHLATAFATNNPDLLNNIQHTLNSAINAAQQNPNVGGSGGNNTGPQGPQQPPPPAEK